jgi:ATP-dependent RNA helicase DDX24/MAK5
MLAKPLVAQGVSTKFITSGSRPIVDDLLAGESKHFGTLFLFETEPVLLAHETLLGLKKTEARSELALKHTNRAKKKTVVQPKAAGSAKAQNGEEDRRDAIKGLQKTSH